MKRIEIWKTFPRHRKRSIFPRGGRQERHCREYLAFALGGARANGEYPPLFDKMCAGSYIKTKIKDETICKLHKKIEKFLYKPIDKRNAWVI